MKKDAGTVVREFLDAFNSNNLERALAHCASNAQITTVPFGASMSVRDDFKVWKEAFPDAKVQISHLVAQENAVVVEFTARGTHRGILRSPTGDIPPRNRKVEMKVIESYDLRDGKIVAARIYFDGLSFLQQLGVGERAEEQAPAPEAR